MAYDAGMLRCVVNEINALGACKVEKIYQPMNDEIVLMLHAGRESLRLLINAGSNYPRLHFTNSRTENPTKAPMFCMLLRKHLAGAKLICVNQIGYERVCELELEAYDEMGYKSKKYLICEIMGKHSNLILTDSDKKIISALKIIDFSTSSQRQILPGMKYELPPKQDKLDTMQITECDFELAYDKASPEMKCDKFITNMFLGIAISSARQIAYKCTLDIDSTLETTNKMLLSNAFFDTFNKIKSNSARPYIIYDPDGAVVEYSYMPLEFYGDGFVCEEISTFSEAIDLFYAKKSKNERIRQRSADIFRLLTNAQARVTRKIAIQTEELAECEKCEEFKLLGDLITANIYLMKRGQQRIRVINYYDESCPEVEIELDNRLTPAQNAQKYYKKYNKAKKAKTELTKQIELARAELEYIETVFEALSKAETESDLAEIRDELYHSGYASRMKNYSSGKPQAPKPLKFKTTNGYIVLCGKNNKQNDYITTKLASKADWWFHVKNLPGSHVLLQTDGEEPPEIDFTEAAEIAAFYSKAEGNNIAVDYTHAKNVKKPAGSKPGYVIYHVNWTAYVTPNERKIEQMQVK